jgi:uncharacterized membrane protein YdjX (TVP38/TMEM64 family)
MKLFASPESRRRAIVLLAALAVGLVALYVLVQQYAAFVFDEEELRAWIQQFGVFAPGVFVGIQTLQVIVAPIPGQVAALVAGYLFGTVAGTAYSMVGVVLGSAIAFTISKRYGRSAVERLLHEEVIDQFDGFVEQVGLLGLFVFVVIPGLPDDVVCFLAGLTTFRLRTFLAVMIAGRLPGYVITVHAGGSLATGRLLEAGVAVAVVVVFALLGYYKREEIKRQVGEL